MRTKLLLGAFFATLLIALAIFLYHILPPQPRWRIVLPKNEDVVTVDSVHGRIITCKDFIPNVIARGGSIGSELGILDLCTGRCLARAFAGESLRFESSSGLSPDHRYYAVRMDNDNKIGLIDLHSLQKRIVDLKTDKDNQSYCSLDFSPQSKWLAVTTYDKKGYKVIIIDPAKGKIVFETEGSTTFGSYLTRRPLIACQKSLNGSHYTVTLWDLRNGKKVKESPPFIAYRHVAPDDWHDFTNEWSSDGQILIACRDSGKKIPELIVWDVVNNRRKCKLPEEITEDRFHATISLDGKTIAFSARSQPNQLLVFDIQSEKVLATHDLQNKVESMGLIVFAPDCILAMCNHRTGLKNFVIQLPVGKSIRELKDEEGFYVGDYGNESQAMIWRNHGFGSMTLNCRDRNASLIWTFKPQGMLLRDPEFQLYSRLIFVHSAVNCETSPLINRLRQWLPVKNEPTCQLQCLDLASGQVLDRLMLNDPVAFHFSEQHQLLATWKTDFDDREIACWDYPFRPPWMWVIGPPVVIALIGLALCVLVRRMRLGTHRHGTGI